MTEFDGKNPIDHLDEMVPLLTVMAHELLPGIEVIFHRTKHPNTAGAFVGLHVPCFVDIEEWVKNETSERFKDLLKERLIFSYETIRESALDRILQLDKNYKGANDGD